MGKGSKMKQSSGPEACTGGGWRWPDSGSAQRSVRPGEAHLELRKSFPRAHAAPRKRAPSDFLLLPTTTVPLSVFRHVLCLSKIYNGGTGKSRVLVPEMPPAPEGGVNPMTH